MTFLKPDQTFYPSPRMACKAPAERLGYVATLNTGRSDRPDALSVVDLDPDSPDYGRIVNTLEMPYAGDELHHFGWNACSSALCPYAPHPHLERRYLIVPGLRSSRIYIVDTKPDPRRPSIAKIIEPEEVMKRSGYSRPHTIHCGPDAIYVSALGADNGGGGPGGIFMLDHFNFDVLGPWEIDHGPQELAYDFWWHITEDTMITSEWGFPKQFEDGLVLEDILAGRYGHNLHFWDMRRRRHLQSINLGDEYQFVFELRPAHEPSKTYGFAGVVLSLKDLSSSIWTWHRENGRWAARKTIEIPAEPARPDELPPPLKDFKAVPPFVTDIDLSLDPHFFIDFGETRTHQVRLEGGDASTDTFCYPS